MNFTRQAIYRTYHTSADASDQCACLSDQGACCCCVIIECILSSTSNKKLFVLLPFDVEFPPMGLAEFEPDKLQFWGDQVKKVARYGEQAVINIPFSAKPLPTTGMLQSTHFMYVVDKKELHNS